MRLAVFIFLAIVAVATAIIGTLVVAGVVPLPWQHRTAARRLAPGAALCPIATREVHAYTPITADDLIDPQTDRLATRAQSAAALAMADPPLRETRELLGRIPRVDLPPGSLFHNGDFYPLGTLPGSAAGIPVGKRAITLDATTVSGARTLRLGDHVDLDAAQVYDASKSRGTPLPPLALRTASVQHLARNGVVVQPLTTQQVPYMTAGGLTSAAQVRTKPVQELTIAVDPAEATAVEQAVAAGAGISCLLHSGRPTTAQTTADAVNTDGQPSRFVPVEQIVGSQHTYKYLSMPPAQGVQP